MAFGPSDCHLWWCVPLPVLGRQTLLKQAADYAVDPLEGCRAMIAAEGREADLISFRSVLMPPRVHSKWQRADVTRVCVSSDFACFCGRRFLHGADQRLVEQPNFTHAAAAAAAAAATLPPCCCRCCCCCCCHHHTVRMWPSSGWRFDPCFCCCLRPRSDVADGLPEGS